MFTNETFGEKRFYQSQPQPSGRLLLTLWAVLSLMWAGGVVFDLYHKATTQADMSRAVERELDQGLIQASCTGVQCSGAPQAAAAQPAAKVENWSDIANTYVKFGRGQMAECLFGPPIALFIVGLGGMIFYRKRHINNRSFIYSRFE